MNMVKKITTKYRVVMWCGIFLVLSIFIGSFFYEYKEAPLPKEFAYLENGDEISLIGYVKGIEKKEQIQNLTLEVKGNAGISYWQIQDPYFTDIKIGNYIQLEGNLLFFDVARNPGNFDPSIYYDNKKLVANVYLHRIEIIDHSVNVLSHSLFEIKNRGMEILMETMGAQHGGLLGAIIFGDKNYMDGEQKERFQKIGISHIFAISGLHISIISLLIYEYFRKKSGSFICGSIGACIILGLYLLMTGGGVSSMRASIMFLVKLGAEITGRVYDMKTSVSLSAIVLLIDVPGLLFEGGFLLSYGAILSVFLLIPIMNLIGKRYGKCTTLLLGGIGIQLMLLPILLQNFYEFCIYSIFLNMLIIPIMPFLLGGGIIGCVIILICKPIGALILLFLSGILESMDQVALWVIDLPFARQVWGKTWWPYVCLYYFFLIILMIQGNVLLNRQVFIDEYLRSEAKWDKKFTKKEKRQGKVWENKILVRDAGLISTTQYELLYTQKRNLTILLICLLSMPLILSIPKPRQDLEITMVDVGQGDGIHIQKGNGIHYFIDGGSSDIKNVEIYRIEPYLLSQGVKELDYVFISHGDIDHYNGIKAMLMRQQLGVKIKNIVVVSRHLLDDKLEELVETAHVYGTNVLYMDKGDQIIIEDLVLTCIAPQFDYSGEIGNPSSMVLDLAYFDFHMLFTGDLEGDGEREYLDYIKQFGTKEYDVLKVAHHGSKNSTPQELLAWLNPSISIISAGVNSRYGHPHIETLSALQESGSVVYATNEVGAIHLKYNKKRNRIQVFPYIV